MALSPRRLFVLVTAATCHGVCTAAIAGAIDAGELLLRSQARLLGASELAIRRDVYSISVAALCPAAGHDDTKLGVRVPARHSPWFSAYHHVKDIYGVLAALQRRYPRNVRVETTGYTTERRPIRAVNLLFGARRDRETAARRFGADAERRRAQPSFLLFSRLLFFNDAVQDQDRP